MHQTILPFRIDIPQAQIDDLKERLANTRPTNRRARGGVGEYRGIT